MLQKTKTRLRAGVRLAERYKKTSITFYKTGCSAFCSLHNRYYVNLTPKLGKKGYLGAPV
jgi:hypothetical protein